MPYITRADWQFLDGLNASIYQFKGEIRGFASIGQTLLAATSGGLYASKDAGRTWMLIFDKGCNAIETQGSTIYAGTYGDGLFSSSDDGKTWTQLIRPYKKDILLYSKYGAMSVEVDFNRKVSALLVHDDILYAKLENDWPNPDTLLNPMIYSSDNGINWTTTKFDRQIYSLIVGDTSIFAVGNAGILRTDWAGSAKDTVLHDAKISAIASDTASIWAGTKDGSVLRSDDHGANWSSRKNGLLNRSISSLLSSGGSIFAGTDSAGVFLSTDGGNNWASIGLVGKSISALKLIGDTLFIGTKDGQIYYTKYPSIQWNHAYWIGNEPIVVTLASASGKIYAKTDSGLAYVSSNQGATWTPSDTNIQADPPNQEIARKLTANGNPEIVNDLCHKDEKWFAATNRGVYISRDSGSNWFVLRSGIPEINMLSISTLDSFVFVGTSGKGVWRRPVNEIIPGLSPTLLSPFDSSQKVPRDLNISWEPLPGAKLYRILVAQGKDTLINDSNITEPYYHTRLDGQYFDQYFWRVRALASNKVADWTERRTEKSEWSPQWSFNTLLTPYCTPGVSGIITPHSGDTVRLDSAFFSWQYCAILDYYIFRIAKDSSIDSVVFIDSSRVDGGVHANWETVKDLPEEREYWWNLEACSRDTCVPYIAASKFVGKRNVVAVNPNPGALKTNLTFDSGMIRYSLARDGFVSLKLYGLDGKMVMSPLLGNQRKGTYALPLSLFHLHQGVYWMDFKTDDFRFKRKIILMR
jgi:photosystem II stability/assembly factor-like uncharacterized protein